jgi:tRNA (guanine-N7-)-methyltransferase
MLRVPRAKTRLHPLNPLSPEALQPPPRVEWTSQFSNPALPMHLDVGCGYGELLLSLSEQDATVNRLGVDLRERVMLRGRAVAAVQAARLGRSNAAFVLANARHPSFGDLLEGYEGPLTTISVLFPDPWTKQVRRRLMQPELATAAIDLLAPGGQFVLATDNAELASEMRAPFDAQPELWTNLAAPGGDGFVPASPFFTAQSAWERTIKGRSSPIFWSHYSLRKPTQLICNVR